MNLEREDFTAFTPRAAGDGLERLPFEVLHRDVVMLTVESDFVRLHDVGMADACREPRLVEKHAEKIRIFSESGAKALDYLELLEASWAPDKREINHCHPAFSKLGDDS